MDKKKKFDTVQWVREIRDANNRELGHLSTHDFLQTLSVRGERSNLGQRLKEKKSGKPRE